MTLVKRFQYLFFCSALFVLSNLRAKEVVSPQLLDEINKFSSGAKILSGGVLSSSCGKRESLCVIEGDFDGDGKKDYATLLKIGKVEDSVYVKDGKSYPWNKTKVWFVVFLSRPNGDFESFVVKKINKYSLQADVYLKKISSDRLKKFDSIKIAPIDGIGLEFCEESETVYYWDAKQKKFTEIEK